MNTPSYQPITKDEIVLMEKDGVQFRLVSGKFEGQTGPGKSNVLTAMIRMVAGSNKTISLPETNNVLLYVLEGGITVNGEKAAKGFNSGIIYLMLTPFAIMGYVGYRWWKNNEENL